MKINEKLYLRKAILQIKRHARENNEAKAFYSKLNTLDIKSLQDLSFNNDLKFFKEINFILSVIISIISHPHISNKGEDIVLRSDQVHSLQNDMFKKTMMDAKLWKHKKNGEMIPEYVHYYQNVDQLNIYENKFIVMLIDLIENELAKFSDFYSTMILSFKDKSLFLPMI